MTQKSPFWHLLTTLSGSIFADKVFIDSRKKLVKHRYLSPPHVLMVNFSLLTAEISVGEFGAPLQISL